ncbi:MAG: hypothetical protein WBA29_11875 [Xanthobacteraceae bacterium]
MAFGLEEGGVRHRLAYLRELTGNEELLMAELADHLSPAACTTALLAAMTERIGSVQSPGYDQCAALSVGDRERLLLGVCTMAAGTRIDLVADCPCCAARLEIALPLREMLDRETAESEADRALLISASDGDWRVETRLPNGADQERCATTAFADPHRAARDLVAGCVRRLIDPKGRPVAAIDLPAAFEPILSAEFEKADEMADPSAAMVCPDCGTAFDAAIDGMRILRTAFGRSHGIFRDVYRMAQRYHWSEREILALTRTRRKRYLALADEMEARP